MGCKLISFIGFNDGFVGMISPVSYSEIWVEAGNIYSPPCPTIRTAWTAWDATTAISLDWNATGAKLAIEYTYDANGSLIKDLNKGIEIQYNLLNLPVRSVSQMEVPSLILMVRME